MEVRTRARNRPRYSEEHALFVQGHFWVGLLVLARFAKLVPATELPFSPMINLFSKRTHLALYAFLLQPLMGVLMILLERGDIPLDGLMVPSPFALYKALDLLADLRSLTHDQAGRATLGVVLGHKRRCQIALASPRAR